MKSQTRTKKKSKPAPKNRVLLVTWTEREGIAEPVKEAFTTIAAFCKLNPSHNAYTIHSYIQRKGIPYQAEGLTIERIPLTKGKQE
jgi:hypothetical protein